MRHSISKCSLLIFISCLLVLFLCSCSNEVNSETEARRILISTISDIVDIQNVMDDFDKDFLKEKDISNVEKRLEKCLTKIESTEDYYPVDTVQEKYDMAKEQYDKAMKDLKNYKKLLEEQES